LTKEKFWLYLGHDKTKKGEFMMYSKEMTKQMIDGHKTAFETGFTSIVMLQEQTSKAVDHFIKQSPWIPVQAKSMINEWTGMYKKGTMDIKDAVNQNFAKLEEFLTSGLQPMQSKAKSKN
jgi:ubiquinone biosynthesis protein Coq4